MRAGNLCTVDRGARDDVRERWFSAKSVFHWGWLALPLSAAIQIPGHLFEPLLVLDLAMICGGVAMFVAHRRPGVGVRPDGIVVKSPFTATKPASRRFYPWAAVAAFDHPESRLGGTERHGAVELKTTDGEIVALPSVRDTRALVAELRERLTGPVNLR